VRTNFISVLGYEGYYAINPDGEVYSTYTGLVLKHGEASGYPKVTLYRPGKRPKTHLIHRLIAEHFIPNPSDLPEVNHIDGDKWNFKLKNLEWVSSSDNRLHAVRVLGKGNGWGTTRPLVDRRKNCEHCNQEFNYKKKQQRFCGNSCAAKGRSTIELFKQGILTKED